MAHFTKMPGYFVEDNSIWPGHAMTIEVEEVLFEGKSPYQTVTVFKSKNMGNVLALDGIIQLTEMDECAYQEPIVHIPMFAHPNPKRVLCVGGGDGGVIREIVKHPGVEEVVICEIDQMVIDNARKYFPKISYAYDHPKVTLFCGDAFQYIKEQKNMFDVIVSDTSDPNDSGPASVLFKASFYQDMYDALKPGGKVATQGECFWKDMELITGLMKDVKETTKFESVQYASTQIPTYPLGQIGFILCSKPLDEAAPNKEHSMRKMVREIPADMKLEFYDAEMHDAAFALPVFVKKAFKAAGL